MCLQVLSNKPGSSDSVVTGCGWITGVQFLARSTDFSVSHHVQTGSGVHSAPYPICAWGSTSTPLYTFMVCVPLRDNFYITFCLIPPPPEVRSQLFILYPFRAGNKYDTV
jgi:hypothetical protein